jgi:mono/diheme cytochrome c family protein
MRAQRRGFVMFVVAAWALAPAASGQSPKPLLEFYASQAKAADPTFSAFSADRGEHLFRTKFSTGKPDTPSCTTCHTTDPKNVGQTRAGKDIDPMAASANPKRYTDQAKTEKWFGRNCNNVLGRECTPTEKGDFITYMLSQ